MSDELQICESTVSDQISNMLHSNQPQQVLQSATFV